MERTRDVHDLQSAGVPRVDHKVRQHSRVVSRIGGELLGGGIDLRLERLCVLDELELAHDSRSSRIFHVDDSHPAPRPSKGRRGERSVNLINVHLEGATRYWNR